MTSRESSELFMACNYEFSGSFDPFNCHISPSLNLPPYLMDERGSYFGYEHIMSSFLQQQQLPGFNPLERRFSWSTTEPTIPDYWGGQEPVFSKFKIKAAQHGTSNTEGDHGQPHNGCRLVPSTCNPDYKELAAALGNGKQLSLVSNLAMDDEFNVAMAEGGSRDGFDSLHDHLQSIQMCSLASDQYYNGDHLPYDISSSRAQGGGQQESDRCLYTDSSLEDADSSGNSVTNSLNENGNDNGFSRPPFSSEELSLKWRNLNLRGSAVGGILSSLGLHDESSSIGHDQSESTDSSSNLPMSFESIRKQQGTTSVVEGLNIAQAAPWMAPGCAMESSHTNKRPRNRYTMDSTPNLGHLQQSHHFALPMLSAGSAIASSDMNKRPRNCYTLESIPKLWPLQRPALSTLSPSFAYGKPEIPIPSPVRLRGNPFNETSLIEDLNTELTAISSLSKNLPTVPAFRPSGNLYKEFSLGAATADGQIAGSGSGSGLGSGSGSGSAGSGGLGDLTTTNRRQPATSNEPSSVAARRRRRSISEKIKILNRLIPGGSKLDTAAMLDEASCYVKFLQLQLRFLESMSQGVNLLDPLFLSDVLQQKLFKLRFCFVPKDQSRLLGEFQIQGEPASTCPARPPPRGPS